MKLTSGSFAHGEPIPQRHTCDGEDVSPPLAWTDVPAEAGSLALLVDDPDAPGGSFTHWMAWGIDPAARHLRLGRLPARRGPMNCVEGYAPVYGGTIPALTWHDLMTGALANMPAENFPTPSSLAPGYSPQLSCTSRHREVVP